MDLKPSLPQMLFAFEQILENDKSDEQWKTSIKSQLERHAWYLKSSNSANRDEWSNELKSMINDVCCGKGNLASHM